MEFFQYKAMDDSGRIQVGKADAINIADLEMRLRKMGLDLINYKELGSQSSSVSGHGINRRDLILLCFHLEQTARAGVPVLESLEDLRDSAENTRLREVISAMGESIEGGKTLSQAMQDFPGVFSKVFCNLVKAGEQSGEMSEVFMRLGENLKWQDEQASQAKKVIIYPAVVLAVVVGVLFFLMTYLVPELLSFVTNMGQELPMHTRALIATSNVFANYWYIILSAPVLFFVLLFAGMKMNPDWAVKIDALKLKLPVIGPILNKLILARLSGFFAMMYASGITIIDCIRTGEDIAGNRAVEASIKEVGRQIADGKSLSDSFDSSGLFPPLVLRMIRVGESTGALQQSLENVSYFYTRDVRESIDRLQALIEPGMTVILGALLGWVMFSVLGPIYDLITDIQL